MSGGTITPPDRSGARGFLARSAGALRWLLPALPLLLTLALVAAPARADPLDDQTRQVAKQLQCPICAGQSVADSPSGLAEQMRGLIRKKLEAGESPEQIVQYFVERYGEGILLEPPKRGLSLAVWWAPLVVLVGGAALVVLLVRAWLRPNAPRAPVAGPNGATPERASVVPGAAPADPYTTRAEQELADLLAAERRGSGSPG